ncbi:MAG: GNAT family N-acetyltransferase [Bacteroidia bacterium]|nr:GNAT family N-acetyltransferase [Bacteroidia bacterium]
MSIAENKTNCAMELKPVILDTQRLSLIGYTPEGIAHIFNHHSQVEIMEILGHRTEEDYVKEKNKVEQGYATYNRTFILFLLCEKVSNTIIGRCGLHNWNPEHSRAELGYNLHDDSHKRQGFMSEAVAAVLDYGFKYLKLNRIEALVAADNTASLKILENQHFVKEGLLRKHYFVSNNYTDSVMFSKLASEHLGQLPRAKP